MSIHTDLDNKILNTIHCLTPAKLREGEIQRLAMQMEHVVHSEHNLWGWAFVQASVPLHHYKLIDMMLGKASEQMPQALMHSDFGILKALSCDDMQGERVTIQRFSPLLGHLSEQPLQRIFDLLLEERRFAEIDMLARYKDTPFVLQEHLRPQMNGLIARIIEESKTYLGGVVDTIPKAMHCYQGDGREFDLFEKIVDAGYVHCLKTLLPHMHVDVIEQGFFRALANTNQYNLQGSGLDEYMEDTLRLMYDQCADFLATFDQRQLQAIAPRAQYPLFWEMHDLHTLRRNLTEQTQGAHSARAPKKI